MQKVKGTYDVLPQHSSQWLFLEQHIHQIMKKHHISYVRTPVFEYYDVFHRQTEASDMVTKETYDFDDRGGRKITLRPEGTAGVIRSIVENKLITPNQILKTYYLGANYRYERPQKGRYREFYQTGIEMIGEKDAMLDAELIQIAYELISKLGIQHIVVKLNHLGDVNSREAYKEALKAFLEPLKDQLSDESKHRLTTNPLRILDSKIPSDQALLKDAPHFASYISDEDKVYFKEILDDVGNFFNVVLTKSTKIIDVTGKESKEIRGYVPERSVVIPGSYTKTFPAGDFQVPCALIIGQRKASTDLKTSLNDALRTHNVAV